MAVIQKTAGIILSARPFKESSLIVSILTKKFGRIKVVAKGCRRPRSKFCGALEPFNRDEIIFYHRELKDLYTLSDAVVIDGYPGIRGSLARVTAAQVMCEFIDKALPPGEPDDRAYSLLSEFLGKTAAEPEDSLPAFVAVFLAQGLAVAGIAPHLTDCVRCRAQISDRASCVDFSVTAGGVVCAAHPDEASMSVRFETVDALRRLYGHHRVSVNRRIVDDLLALIPPYLATHLNGLTLNALRHLLAESK